MNTQLILISQLYERKNLTKTKKKCSNVKEKIKSYSLMEIYINVKNTTMMQELYMVTY